MRRDTVALAAVLMLTLFAAGLLWILPAHADSRLYPALGLRYRMEDSESPRLRAELGTAFSAGRLAPSVYGTIGLNGKLTPGLEIAVRYRL